MAAKHVRVPWCYVSLFAHVRYGSQMIDRFSYWDDPGGDQSGRSA